MGRIKLAIVGAGNCASSLVQGLEHYKGAEAEDAIGLIHFEIGGYRPADIALISPAAFLMKHPPQQFTDDEAHRRTEDFIAGRRER